LLMIRYPAQAIAIFAPLDCRVVSRRELSICGKASKRRCHGRLLACSQTPAMCVNDGEYGIRTRVKIHHHRALPVLLGTAWADLKGQPRNRGQIGDCNAAVSRPIGHLRESPTHIGFTHWKVTLLLSCDARSSCGMPPDKSFSRGRPSFSRACGRAPDRPLCAGRS
jgi:hypothetical protein